TSPWASPIILVRKKDRSTRFCVDYRRLNDITKKDSYPLPRIDDTLDTLSGNVWFSTLDLKSSYWQVEMDPVDREKTAFTTSGQGLWQFNVMPFSLCNAPDTFERLMETVLRGLSPEAYLIYLDDIIIVGLTEHKRPFVWSEECEVAFTSLKEALTSAPILSYPDPDKQFILDTDASHANVGAVLSQEIDGQKRVFAYWTEMKYGKTVPVVRQITASATSHLDPWSDEEVREAQMKDPDQKPFIERMESSSGGSRIFWNVLRLPPCLDKAYGNATWGVVIQMA
ncbi:retrovirus-related Pol polyprotein from transposon 297, partial [Nephila pilipes]